VEKKPISKLALTSLILALLPFCITNIVSLVLGIGALQKIKKSSATSMYNMKGRWMAIVGIILSSFIILLYLCHDMFIPIHRIPMSASKTFAVNSLRRIASAEDIWRQQDIDRNGIKDYWTYDVSCLHRMYRLDNSTKVDLIYSSIASLDALPADVKNINFFGDEPRITPLNEYRPKYGYYFRAMMMDENGIPYNQNPVGTNKILATNNNKFAFVAYPLIYGEYSTYTVIVNEKEIVYIRDFGSDGKKIVLQWPAPEELEGKNAKWIKE
jgi:hypothetical protein